MPAFDVVGVGENSVDVICRVPAAVAPNIKIPIVGRRVMLGGQVATTLATCASLGLRVAYVGAFGDDPAGSTLREALELRGVDTSHCVVRDVRSRNAVILVNDINGDRTVLWERDPQLDLRGDEIPAAAITSARVLHVDDVDRAATLSAAAIAHAAGIPVTSDFDQITEHTVDLLSAVSVPILAEPMPAALTGVAEPERALRTLRRSHQDMLCVTLGTRGAMMLAGDRSYTAPAFNVTVVDTTGAGDVFRGAFIVAMLRGDRPDQILRFANAAAAIACTREGALDSVPTLDEVHALM
ncbi:MAG TPA: PfkB family carbohydrate kinase [Vicinamibacterales bacterium]|nr:PfkB family carbohydrate kinase [Vicinamibacterales bacterium]